MLSRFHLIPERYGRTDRQTDRFAISISRINMLTRDKNTVDDTRNDSFTEDLCNTPSQSASRVARH